MYFLVNASSPKLLDNANQTLKLLRSQVTLTTKVKGQIMYFLVNASPPRPLDVATSNFVGA